MHNSFGLWLLAFSLWLESSIHYEYKPVARSLTPVANTHKVKYPPIGIANHDSRSLIACAIMVMASSKKVWFPSGFRRILSPVKTYSVLLADDHQILLDGLRTLIESNKMFDVKNMASTGTDALGFLKKTDYDILVTDYEMPGLTGLELVKAARTLQPEIKVIVLSMHDDPAVVKEMLREGANAYILKKDSHRSLSDALQKVVEGKRFLSDEVSEILIHADNEEEKGTLTSRENEVLRLVAKEFNSRQIAEILFISERTVETHRKNILRKTGATNLVGLIKYAYANNLI